MSDPVPGSAGLPEPVLPEPALPEPGPISGGEETVRVPLEPEVPWSAPEPPRALPWEVPVDAAPAAPADAAPAPPAQPWSAPPLTPGGPGETTPAGGGWTTPPPAGVLSATAVGWSAPPPEPVATGQAGWVIASTGIRVAAYLVDGILSGFIIGAIAVALLSISPGLIDGGTTVYLAYTVGVTGFYFLYFVGFWTSAGKATPGMRVFRLQVANAADGKRLEIGAAIVRWLAIGYAFSIIGLVPVLSGLAGLAAFVWYIVLLATTAGDPMHQGFHDRWAKSVVVRPAVAGSGAGRGLMTCLIVAVVLGALLAILLTGIVVLSLARYG